ncbi:hypothetical protein [Anaerococcus sp.]|uniref:hypothetical protein n=1 Tax=Anaerococcus sp. TaxID=1872515 RepID=UPI002587F21B|nr:hypothetical protein [Anaerococcus sp.]MDU3211993.1 hypothetical protein [Anaerococcus sp.]
MKDTIKFFSIITGIFRSIMTILFLLGVVFTVLVDVNLLIAFLDLLGFTGISLALVKPIIILGFILLFIVNFVITRHIFKAANTGEYHLSNFVFALLFLSITIFFYVTFRNLTTNAIYVLFVLNGILVINSLLGLIARTKGIYAIDDNTIIENKTVNNKNYIEFDENPQIYKNNKDQTEHIKRTTDNKNNKVKVIPIPLSQKSEEESIKNKKSISEKQAKESNIPKDTKVVFESGNNNNISDNTEEIKTNKNSTENSQKDKEN